MQSLSMIVSCPKTNGPTACPFETAFMHIGSWRWEALSVTTHWWRVSTIRSCIMKNGLPCVCFSRGSGPTTTLTLTAVWMGSQKLPQICLSHQIVQQARISCARIWDRVTPTVMVNYQEPQEDKDHNLVSKIVNAVVKGTLCPAVQSSRQENGKSHRRMSQARG